MNSDRTLFVLMLVIAVTLVVSPDASGAKFEVVCPPNPGLPPDHKFSDEPLFKKLENGKLSRIKNAKRRAIARLACENSRTFVPNIFPTTKFGPAYANIVLEPQNFLGCRGGPYALCYYSGPEPQTCKVTKDGRFANCECFEIAYGPYFVDINAIQNFDVYLKTIQVCGHDGSACWQDTNGEMMPIWNKAPVCEFINAGTLFPNADLVSTFSLDCAPEEGIGQTTCEKALYAGCMTAPCYRNGEAGIVECLCPTFDGPYQVGEFEAQCELSSDLTWSAAYNPNEGGTTFPGLPLCIPDAPGSFGCPLWTQETVLPPNSGVDCQKVCDEYSGCQAQGDVETGFTCDATLCTAGCQDRDLVGKACSGLQNCDVSEIIKAETAAQCSCCASQLCGCQPNATTNAEIAVLDQLQRDRGIVPQCDQNETLCGTTP